MTLVMYHECDRCKARMDSPHDVYNVLDLNGALVGHLFLACAKTTLPTANWVVTDATV